MRGIIVRMEEPVLMEKTATLVCVSMVLLVFIAKVKVMHVLEYVAVRGKQPS